MAKRVDARRDIVSTDEVIQLDYGHELYTSQFCFGEEMRNHLANTKSVIGYDGPVYGHHFCLDIDSKGGVDSIVPNMVGLLDEMERMAIPYALFFSGFKGFHIYVPKQYIAYDPSLEDHWHVASKLFAKEICDRFPNLAQYIDLGIYDQVRLFRYPYSFYPASKEKKKEYESKKTQLAYDTKTGAVQAISQPDIPVMLDYIFRGLDFPPSEVDQWFELKGKALDTEPEPPSGSISIEPHEYTYGEKRCITHILNDHVCDNARHKTALRLLTYWKEKGLPKRVAELLLRDWNSKLDPVRGSGPMAEAELSNLTRHYNTKTYTFTCDDEIKKRHCLSSCHMFRAKDVLIARHVFTPEKAVEAMREIAHMSGEFDIALHKLYPEFMPLTIRPCLGDICVVASGPSVGKTTLMLNIMLATVNVNWIYFSYEMSAASLTEVMWKILGLGDIDDPKELAKYKQYAGHILFIDNGQIRTSQMKEVILAQEAEQGKTFHAICIDHLQHIPSSQQTATERAQQIVKDLRDITLDLKKAVFVLSHVPKDAAGEGNLPLTMQAPKDSGEITGAADVLLCLWRPYRKILGEVDDTLTVGVEKYRKGRSAYTANLYYDLDKGLILPYSYRDKKAA